MFCQRFILIYGQIFTKRDVIALADDEDEDEDEQINGQCLSLGVITP